MVSAALLFGVLWPLTGSVELPPGEVWFALVVTGLIASALAFFVQTSAQRHLSTAQTAIILTTEPAFAAFFGNILADERLTVPQYLGAGLILAALLISELAPILARQRTVRRG
jgi:drug/metabolite transporter (DMT)-like permease